jgi:hypothetical protein
MRPDELRNFELTERQKAVRAMARNFAQKEILPLGADNVWLSVYSALSFFSCQSKQGISTQCAVYHDHYITTPIPTKAKQCGNHPFPPRMTQRRVTRCKRPCDLVSPHAMPCLLALFTKLARGNDSMHRTDV